MLLNRCIKLKFNLRLVHKWKHYSSFDITKLVRIHRSHTKFHHKNWANTCKNIWEYPPCRCWPLWNSAARASTILRGLWKWLLWLDTNSMCRTVLSERCNKKNKTLILPLSIFKGKFTCVTYFLKVHGS